MDDDQARVQDSEAAAQPAQGRDRAREVDAQIAALARLLARQAAREHLHRLSPPDSEETTDGE